MSCPHHMKRLLKTSAVLVALVFLDGCASPRQSSHQLNQQIAQADAALANLDAHQVSTYNKAVESIARSDLDSIGIKLDRPKMPLPLARYYVAPETRAPNETTGAGVPMLLDYDTSHASLYPRDGLIIPATAVYRRIDGTPHLSLLTAKKTVELSGATYPLNIDNAAPVTAMARRGRHVARAGFRNMLRPAAMPEGPRIFLTEPYDPNKITVLLIPGLQSTPFAFVDLLKAMRVDPEVSEHFQVWTFLYATGTPVMLNALELREQLEKTISDVDPADHDFATRHIVVVGHSMGGLIAHTLVSDSGERLWNALFAVPPQRLKGDRAIIRRLVDGLHFQRNPRVVAAIFAATPHRGSQMAEGWIGQLAASLIRLPPDLQSDIVKVVSENPDAATPTAKAFHRQMNFSSVRTLSPRDPVLQAMVDLPIEVPFHSIIGKPNAGPIETSSDGVVPYASAHLAGALSELVVRSGHGVSEKREAQREVNRILLLELHRTSSLTQR